MYVVGSKRSSMLTRTGKRQRVEKEESLLQKMPKAILLYILSFLNFDDVLIGLRLASHYFKRFIDLEKRSIKNIVYRKSLLDCNINRLLKNIQEYNVDINVHKIDIIDEKDELESKDIECLKRFSPKIFCLLTKNYLYDKFDFDFSRLESYEITSPTISVLWLLISSNKLKFLKFNIIDGFEIKMYEFLKKIKTEKLVLDNIGISIDINFLLENINPSVKHLKLFAGSKTTINQDDLKYIPDTIKILETNINSPLPADSNVEILVLRNVDGNRFRKTFDNLKYWKNLKKVVCINCDLPALFYVAIGKNKSITHLSIYNDDFFAPILFVHLKNSNITHVKISRSENVSDVFGYYVNLLPKLQYLELTSDLSGKFFFRIKHKSIKYIKINGSIYFCNSAIRSYPPHIEEIYIKDISLIDNGIIEYLKELKNLKKITFEKCPSISNIELYRKELSTVKSITII